MNDFDRECVLPVLLVIGLSLLIGLLVYWDLQYIDWVQTNCDQTEEIRTVQDDPVYMDVGGPDNVIMVPVGGGEHEERLWLCHAPEKRVWLRD